MINIAESREGETQKLLYYLTWQPLLKKDEVIKSIQEILMPFPINQTVNKQLFFNTHV